MTRLLEKRPLWLRIAGHNEIVPGDVVIVESQIQNGFRVCCRKNARDDETIVAVLRNMCHEKQGEQEGIWEMPELPWKPLVLDPTAEQEERHLRMFPIRYHNLWDLYQRAKASFWTPEEIDFARDIQDFRGLPDNIRHYIEMVLAFFASSDNLVMKNLDTNFLSEVVVPEARMFYAVQEFMEAIHAETYNVTIDTLVDDPVRKDTLFGAIDTIPSIRAKADWVLHWISRPEVPFAMRLLAFACVEGIFFSSAFCSIYWIRTKRILEGLCVSNEFISRDEGLHTLFACELYKMMGAPIPEQQVHALLAEAVLMEDHFVDEALPDDLLGMNRHQMRIYVRFVADWLLTTLGYSKLYYVANPFPFMEMISLEGKTNFFEKRNSQYAKLSNAGGNEITHTFTMDEDF
jgi:ribonucleoside-diphosphate reductase beta chain